jgi:hypothetical protein
MANFYQLMQPAAMRRSTLAGRFLAHNRRSRIERAFMAADLRAGAKTLVEPTLRQAAMLAGVNPTYAWWAARRIAERAEIEAGFVPLVPPRINGGTALIVANNGIDDAESRADRLLGWRRPHGGRRRGG